jgi:hypothetical protein
VTGALIGAVGVVVPVHDEVTHLPACLSAIDCALTALPRSILRFAVVVLDACTDGSDGVAQRWASGENRALLRVDFRSVGRARAAGMARVLERLSPYPAPSTWLATTDADSVVPHAWLTEQLRLANAGAAAVAGSIQVGDWDGYPARVVERFLRFYEPPGSGDAHTHVHGANLGVRADAYLEVGGFEPIATGEDHALWTALQRAARPRVSSRRLAVQTSARRHARAPRGFSDFLAALAARAPGESET